MSEDLERRLARVEEALAHQGVALEDLDAAVAGYRRDIEALQARLTRLELQFAAMIEQLSEGLAGAGD